MATRAAASVEIAVPTFGIIDVATSLKATAVSTSVKSTERRSATFSGGIAHAEKANDEMKKRVSATFER